MSAIGQDGVGRTGYSHVAIAVTDLDAARAFYCGLLGLTELPRPDFGVPGAWLRTGDLQLHLVETDTMPVPGPGFPHVAFYVPTDRFETTVADLAGGGVEVIAPPHRREDFGVPVWAAFVKDPAGNVVELTDVGPLT